MALSINVSQITVSIARRSTQNRIMKVLLLGSMRRRFRGLRCIRRSLPAALSSTVRTGNTLCWKFAGLADG